MPLSSDSPPSSFISLPLEIHDNIAFHLACPQLLGLPVSLAPLFSTCRLLYHKLSKSTALYARIFKYKFSFSAIRRRAFVPKSSEYMWQLKWYSSVLKDVRRRVEAGGEEAYAQTDVDAPCIEEILFALWLMCLDDDGCNRIQMERARVYEWVETYITQRLYVDASGGWPLENPSNSCALWVMWYLTTKARLLAESDSSRENLIRLILPYVTVPYRYPMAFAPPNHFHFPLKSSPFYDSADSRPSHSFSIPTPHGPYPIYLSPNRVWLHVHFERRTPMTVPLVSESAKLLYFSRRELTPFPVPPVLPANREEFRSRLRVRLTTEAGVQLDPAELERRVAQEIGVTREDLEELNANLLGGDLVESATFGKGGGTALVKDVRASIVINSFGDVIEVDESGCQSQNWDNDWWRLRQCSNCWNDDDSDDDDDDVDEPTAQSAMMAGHPQLGRMYSPGSLSGLWAGRMLIPAEAALEALLRPVDQVEPQGPHPFIQANPEEPVPLPQDFNEDSLHLVTVPVYMRLQEHVSYHPNKIAPCGGQLALALSHEDDPDVDPEAEADFDQGLGNGYFPLNTELKPTLDGTGVAVVVPPLSSASGSREEYIYHTFKKEKSNLAPPFLSPVGSGKGKGPQPGRFHDVDRCPGCRAREDALFKARKTENETSDHSTISTSMSSTTVSTFTSLADGYTTSSSPATCGPTLGGINADLSRITASALPGPNFSSFADAVAAPECTESDDFPPHDPHNVLTCDGIQDIIITGETDDRHGQAWNHFTFQGRVRKFDGMVGILRTPRNSRLGKVFFYGNIVGGQNFVGQWRIAHEDPGAPAYEGAFSLGRKIE